MKILHITNVYGQEKGGGIHEVVDNVSLIQSRMGHDVHIWHYGGSTHESNDHDTRTFVKLNSFALLTLYFFPGVQKKLNQWKDFEVIHQHGIFTPASFLIRLIRRKGAQYIIQPHGLLDEFRLKKTAALKSLVLGLYERQNLIYASSIVACSKEERSSLLDVHNLKNVYLINNGVRSEFLNPKVNRKRELTRVKRLLFLSQLIPVKGLDRLFEVLVEIKDLFYDWELIIAGNNGSTYSRMLLQKVQEFELENCVKFVGAVFGNDKLNLYDTADLFILPSFNENFGIVVVEALSRELPVLTTKGTPWSDLESHRCGLWVDNTKQGLKDGLLELIATTSSERRRMGVNGKKLVLEKYTWTNSVDKLMDMYNSVSKNEDIDFS